MQELQMKYQEDFSALGMLLNEFMNTFSSFLKEEEYIKF